ncbi:MAG: amidohydrolase family protein, partial [Ruthenibacterium sp.]
MQKNTLSRRIAVAQGQVPADLVLKNATVVNVFTQELLSADIAIADGVIAGLGSYHGLAEVDCTGKTVCPGLIDAHMHMESTMVAPAELARAIVPTGTTTLIADPHELVNVCGAEGVRYFLEATEGLPL